MSKKEVRYLAFEGGGGRGVTYLGAVRALEELNLLPIKVGQPKANQIKGIAGASAGAITALLLAMGLKSGQLEEVLAKSDAFIGFFDEPNPGRYKMVDKSGVSIKGPPREVFRLKADLKEAVAPAGSLPGLVLSGSETMWDALLSTLLWIFVPKDAKIVGAALRRDPIAYVENLLVDGGIFPGLAARTFLRELMGYYLSNQMYSHAGGYGQVRGAETIGFESFSRMTGVDLVITGTNLHTGRPRMFSRRLTPTFPVVDAVSISMNLPVVFKPVRVEAQVPVTKFNSDPNAYIGWWCDGGVLNNMPIHAFDENYLNPEKADKVAGLSNRMVALRLTEGEPPTKGQPSTPRFTPEDDTLKHIFKMVFNALMWASEEGQLRTEAERAQTIDLYTYKLTLLDFAPEPGVKDEPIMMARKSVLNYFGIGT